MLKQELLSFSPTWKYFDHTIKVSFRGARKPGYQPTIGCVGRFWSLRYTSLMILSDYPCIDRQHVCTNSSVQITGSLRVVLSVLEMTINGGIWQRK